MNIIQPSRFAVVSRHEEVFKKIYQRVNTALCSLLMLVTLGVFNPVNAALVVYQDVGFITNSYLSSTNRFQASQQNEPMGIVETISFTKSGSYELTLFDFIFPSPLSELRVWLRGSDGDTQFLNGPGSFTFEVTKPDMYFLALEGRPSGIGSIGLYGVQIQAVPLPPAAILLLSAIGLLLGFDRWQQFRARSTQRAHPELAYQI